MYLLIQETNPQAVLRDTIKDNIVICFFQLYIILNSIGINKFLYECTKDINV